MAAHISSLYRKYPRDLTFRFSRQEIDFFPEKRPSKSIFWKEEEKKSIKISSVDFFIQHTKR